MKDRIVWIDWLKSIGITIVVFCHTPQVQPAPTELAFLQLVQMPLMFLISGMLYKASEGKIEERVRKYWKQLILPMLLFALIGWPYYIVREYVDGNTSLDIFLLAPIRGLLVGNIVTNSVFWFVVALVEMKILLDTICLLWRKPISALFVIVSTILAIVAHLLVEHFGIRYFQLDNVFKYLPIFIFGHYLRPKLFHSSIPLKGILVGIPICFIPPFLYVQKSPAIDIVALNNLTYIISATCGAIFMVLLSMLFKQRSKIIETMSRGTIVILGLHFMGIGIFNLIVKQILGIHGEIQYSTPQAALVAMLITTICYFAILFCQKYCKVLLGGR